MLIDFTIENFLSIKDKLTFSMIASDEENGYEIKTHKLKSYLKLLPAVTIYGFNASGKSNLIKAMSSLKNQIIYSKVSDLSLIDKNIFEYKPYKLDDSYLSVPTSSEIRIFIDELIFEYCLSYNNKEIVSESLVMIDRKDNYVTLFKRTSDLINIDYNIDISIIKKVAGESLLHKPIIGTLSIFDERVTKFVDWMEKDFLIIENAFDSKENLKRTTSYLLNKDSSFHVKLIKMLNDISYSNINQIRAENVKDCLDYEDINQGVKKILQTNPNIKQVSDGDDNDDSKFDEYTLNTFKQGYDIYGNKRDVVFNLFEESEGTIKIYALYAYIYDALYFGKTLIIDEMTSYIHPLVSRYILDLFQNPQENKSGQLVISTHTTDLLEMKSLRKDQVYVADKEFNETKIYSLSDIYDVSRNENFRNAYLSGKYGGLNYFRRELNE
ncbi:AAA family ATPase [Peptostreptococcus faecalis]|uniref:AAA family ATPase n=1 Tax=Peptostreptococcus faecalis TaxID=2045015 RepID=UPI000C7AADAB|nr:ATP-binding protein [Peptostreptococcus faecalis]